MRKLTWSLLLPFFLLFAQQGELRHEIGHLADPLVTSQKQKSGETKPCEVCLAYSHFAGTASVDVLSPALLGDLAYHFASEPGIASAPAVLLTPRSRGPPLS